jgi:replicative DNA helicase
MPESHYTTAANLFDPWRADLLTGTPPTLYPVGSGALTRIELGPGLLRCLGDHPVLAKHRWQSNWLSMGCGSPFHFGC